MASLPWDPASSMPKARWKYVKSTPLPAPSSSLTQDQWEWCINTLTPSLCRQDNTTAHVAHWLLDLSSRVKFQLTTLITCSIMGTLLAPFLSRFPIGVSWSHLSNELFVSNSCLRVFSWEHLDYETMYPKFEAI